MKHWTVLIALTLALPAGSPAAATVATPPSRRTLVTSDGAELVEWTNGPEFGFESCDAGGCVAIGLTRAVIDRDLVGRRLANYLREKREPLIYGDDAAAARRWYWPAAAVGTAGFLGGLRHFKISPRHPRAIFHALLVGTFAGIAVSAGIYGNRSPRDANAAVMLLTNDPLLAEGLPLEAYWDLPGARWVIWGYLVLGLAHATAAVPAPTPGPAGPVPRG